MARHIKTLQQKHDFNHSKGMKAYYKQGVGPSEELQKIWAKKRELINKIIKKTKEDSAKYEFRRLDELREILNNL